MKILSQLIKVHKRFALTISRGTTAENTNIWIRLAEEGIEGWGEVSPFNLGDKINQNTKTLLKELEKIKPLLEKYKPWERQKLEEILEQQQVPAPLKAGIDMALWDWLGKKLGLPLWKLWGLNLDKIGPTSVTIGINTPELGKQRLKEWQKLFKVEVVKVKLGSPEGIAADQEMFLGIKELWPQGRLTVDANGGWSWSEALQMSEWLGNQGVEYIEQPLAVGEEGNLRQLQERSPLPIFVDESCLTSQDLPKLAQAVAGVNIKVMKAGGITEVWRMVQTARALGLKIMYGCYSDTSLANTAMSHLGPLADYWDLDSHLNLLDDPFRGASLEAGRLIPPDLPGLGVKKNENYER